MNAHPSPQLSIHQTSPIITRHRHHREARNAIRKRPTLPLHPSLAIQAIPVQQTLVIIRIALRAVQAAVQIHPRRRIRAGFLPVRGLAVEDVGIVCLGVEFVGVFKRPVDAEFLPFVRCLIYETGSCVAAEEVGEVEAVRLRGNVLRGKGQGIG